MFDPILINLPALPLRSLKASPKASSSSPRPAVMAPAFLTPVPTTQSIRQQSLSTTNARLYPHRRGPPLRHAALRMAHQAPQTRRSIRIAIPSKGSILADTMDLLADIGMNVQIHNPRQYVASIRGLDVEVWLQRPADIVRKVRDGHVDLGFAGRDLVVEYGGFQSHVIPIHERLRYGECRLAIGVPMTWEDCQNMSNLRARSHQQELRIATKYNVQAAKFLKSHAIDNYSIVAMDGALEASTQMGVADIIIDLVSSGVTLRENLLKEVHGGTICDSSMQLIGNRGTLSEQSALGDRLRSLTREMLERIDAHLMGQNNFSIIANIHGSSMVDVSRRLASHKTLRGVDGPTISSVVPPADSDDGMYAIGIVVPKDQMYPAIEQLRRVGGCGVTVLPVSYIFPQVCARWVALLENIGMSTVAEVK